MPWLRDVWDAAKDLQQARSTYSGTMRSVDNVTEAQHAFTDALLGRGYDQRAETAEAVADARAAAEEARAEEDASHYDTSDDSDVDENVAEFSD